MSLFSSPEEKLFKAIEKSDVKRVRELLATGANASALNKFKITPLDACVEVLKNYVGRGGTDVYVHELDTIFNTKLIWDELVRKGGSLHKYKDDPAFKQGFTVNFNKYGVLQSDLKFPAPKHS